MIRSHLTSVLCEEKLSHIICHEVDNKRWHPLKLEKEGLSISHLMFVDDLILFSKAFIDQMNCIIDCVDLFLGFQATKWIVVSNELHQWCQRNYQKQSIMRWNSCKEFFCVDMVIISREHLIGWNRICTSRWSRGLGFRNLSAMNRTCVAKSTRKFRTCRKELWCWLLTRKYGPSKSTREFSMKKEGDSSFRKATWTKRAY